MHPLVPLHLQQVLRAHYLQEVVQRNSVCAPHRLEEQEEEDEVELAGDVVRKSFLPSDSAHICCN